MNLRIEKVKKEAAISIEQSKKHNKSVSFGNRITEPN